MGQALLSATGLSAIHILAGLDEAHGGPSYSVPRLCEALAAAGIKTSLLSVAPRGQAASAVQKDGYDDVRFPQTRARIPLARSMRLSSQLSAALRKAAPVASVIHNHGLWLAPNFAAGREATRAHKPLIIAPRGMLSPGALSFSPWRKKLVWHLGQGAMIHHAACLHATSLLEYQELRALGLKNPIAIIPNGIDLPEMAPIRDRSRRTVLFLGRMHPKKGLEGLLHAWSLVEEKFPDWHLRIIGPSEGAYDRVLERMIAARGIRHAVLEKALYGDAKLEAYRSADLFVLPSISENFGLTAAEALAAGLPVIATKGTPWNGLAEKACGWWIDQGIEPLAATLTAAMEASPAMRREMGARGRSWMALEFAWDRVAREMMALYSWLVGAKEAPPSVRFA